MKKLLVAALFVVLASPAFAAIQNVKVSGDITTTWIDRSNFDLGQFDATQATADSRYGVSGAPDSDSNYYGLKSQNVFITQTRVRVDADLSDNVSTSVGLINERAWNAENTPNNGSGNSNVSNLDTNVQLYLASVTLREFLYSPLSVTVGRQVFTYGNGLVIGNGPGNQSTGNLQYIAQDLTERTSEDGVRAVLDYKPLTIDLIYFKNAQTTGSEQGLYGNNDGSSDVFGYNANYQLSDPWNTVVEQYLFARTNGDNQALEGPAGTAADKGDTLYVPGLRASTNPVKGLNVQGELAWQLGQKPVTVLGGTAQEAEHRDAMAAQFMASYALPVMEKYKPTVNASYTYLSGDKNSLANDNSTGLVGSKDAKSYSAWDPFSGAMAAGTIWQSLYPLTNLNVISAGASVNPLEDVTTSFTWSNLWAADSYSAVNPLAIYQPDGGTTFLFPNTKADRRGLGNEYDVNLTYNYTEDVTFGVSLGWYVPGSAFEGVTTSSGLDNKTTASQAMASLGVKF